MDIFNKAFAQLSDLFRSMTPGARITAGLLLVVVVVSLGYLFRYQTSAADAYLMNGEPIPASDLHGHGGGVRQGQPGRLRRSRDRRFACRAGSRRPTWPPWPTPRPCRRISAPTSAKRLDAGSPFETGPSSESSGIEIALQEELVADHPLDDGHRRRLGDHRHGDQDRLRPRIGQDRLGERQGPRLRSDSNESQVEVDPLPGQLGRCRAEARQRHRHRSQHGHVLSPATWKTAAPAAKTPTSPCSESTRRNTSETSSTPCRFIPNLTVQATVMLNHEKFHRIRVG